MIFNTALRRLLSSLLVAGLLLTLTAGALADRPDRNGHDRGSDRSSQQTTGISPQQAMAQAQQRYPGKVLSVRRNNGSYKVKMLHEGKVRYVTISAR